MYRIFISYSHEDQDLVSKIAEILEENSLQPMWDRQFAFGHGFHEQIKTFIAHAHVFLPVITKTADERKWVHQEIGYAMSLNIPVLPVTAGRLPGEMITADPRCPVRRRSDRPESGSSQETPVATVIANLVQRYSDPVLALFQCAQFAEDRAAMMAHYSNDVRHIGAYGLVRQKGGLSSFHIPTQSITHRVWKDRYSNKDRGPVHCRLQREERLALEAHARFAGCKLIINPQIQYDRMWGQGAQLVRLRCLLEFLDSMSDRCRVAINKDMDHSESLTILGDWFAAESVTARHGQGYLQTIFTRHAPSMLSRIEAFDAEFQELSAAAKWNADKYSTKTIVAIRAIIYELEKTGQEPAPRASAPPAAALGA